MTAQERRNAKADLHAKEQHNRLLSDQLEAAKKQLRALKQRMVRANATFAIITTRMASGTLYSVERSNDRGERANIYQTSANENGLDVQGAAQARRLAYDRAEAAKAAAEMAEKATRLEVRLDAID